jgi:hypothetical protein
MSVKLNRPPKLEESQKNSNFNGKTISYPGFEPGTSGLAVGSHNHCTIGSVLFVLQTEKIQKPGNHEIHEFILLKNVFLLLCMNKINESTVVSIFSTN